MKTVPSNTRPQHLATQPKTDGPVQSTTDSIQQMIQAEGNRVQPDGTAKLKPKKVAISLWANAGTRFFSDLLVKFLRRPDAPRWIAAMLLLAITITWPWAAFGLCVVGLFVALIAYFSIGPDRIDQMVARWHKRLREEDPEKAEKIRRRAARVSKLITALAERLPKRWTSGLYLPDFEITPPSSQPQKADPFDRLAKQNNGMRDKRHLPIGH